MSSTIGLSTIELEQYSRHLKLPGFGLERQLRLKQAKVLLVGAGGLGCPIGLYLAAAGVGTIGVVDFDRVDRSNLHRQIAHTVQDVGRPKVDSLIDRLTQINPLLIYQSHAERLDENNVADRIRQYDLVIDGSDNFGTRFLLADACFLNKVPLLQGAVYQYEAQMSLFIPHNGPCYRCVFREPPQRDALASCAEVGVLGVLPGTAGLLMATEAIKYLTGMQTAIQGTLLMYNALTQSMKHVGLVPDLACPLCGPAATIRQACEIKVSCPTLSEEESLELEPLAVQTLLDGGAFLLDVREGYEYLISHLPNACHIPLGQLNADAAKRTLPLDGPIVVYCQKGQRSLQAVRLLTTLGYAQCYSLRGGLSGWNGQLAYSD